jgi:hypothetical protein
MFKKLDKPQGELLDQHLVRFDDKFVNERVAGMVFSVRRHIMNPFDVGLVIPKSDFYDLSFLWKLSTTDYVGLIPKNKNSLYEIMVTMKGPGFIVYPMVGDRYLFRLEESNMLPKYDDTTYTSWPALRRYLGGFTEKDIPFVENADLISGDSGLKRGLLRVHTVKDINPPILRLYNDDQWENYGKIVLHFDVNRCMIDEVKMPTQEQIDKARLITHWENYSIGWGGV